MGVQKTNAAVSDPGITFNESGVSFDDSRYSFGGVYGYDVVPIPTVVRNIVASASMRRTVFPPVALAKDVRPTIAGYRDIYNLGGTTTPPSGNSGMLIGMLGLTYP